ncbi:hypothetical protein F0562_009892 [Nyssa sinensis]|uniref:Methyltransferase domain-containing protein n=1 Tax=Nyssa sinensis TaxID=561372 RepID=A0A5J4ZZI6_9ASTE|nr:hypothetical protein F0562_009892 [Nyssa sinensis]
MAGECNYSCQTATETLEWIHAIIDFLRPYSFFLESHVVNFFKTMGSIAQDYWPSSLKEFVLTLRSLALPREQADLQRVFPDLQMNSLSNVLTQGMNRKKKHEVEALAAVVSWIAKNVGAHTIVDVGAGQGYLAQVLSFEYQLSVIAIDACYHHGRITNARAERIKKHYASKMHKSRSEDRSLNIPKTVTCRVLSTDTFKTLSDSLLQKDDVQKANLTGEGVGAHSLEKLPDGNVPSCCLDSKSSLLLAGLHACGDLSVTMLRTFLECTDVKAVASNLLVYHLGKSSRDLACQSAERWRGLGKDAGLHNFELHAFRAAFQMVLFQYYPEILITSPAIGRQGKALRRQQNRRVLESTLHHEEITHSPPSLSQKKSNKKGSWPTMNSAEAGSAMNKGTFDIPLSDTCNSTLKSFGAANSASSILEMDALFHGASFNQSTKCEATKSADKYSLFEKFSRSGLCRLGLHHLQDINLAGLWKETEPFAELIGPYWSLRAALGPVLETILLLDRLLFLQEQGNLLEAVMIPIFDPTLSPRNVALIAKKI